ncbi:hypothetical protein [Neobacillus vireti]|uniref:hypothetical protein n=1 Tax=Neobacillus vireti TaxID=220686 RepID=UPI002FFF3699
MKKIVTLLLSSLIVLLMFAGAEKSVFAAENVIYLGPPPLVQDEEPDDENCTCHELLPLTGSERNMIVADLLKSNVFKNERMRLKKDGYKWYGASGIEVIQPTEGITLVGVPFSTNDGTIEFHTFFIGDFQDFITYIEAQKDKNANQSM